MSTSTEDFCRNGLGRSLGSYPGPAHESVGPSPVPVSQATLSSLFEGGLFFMHAKDPAYCWSLFKSYEHWSFGFQLRVPCVAQGERCTKPCHSSAIPSRANIHTGQAHVCQQATHTQPIMLRTFCFEQWGNINSRHLRQLTSQVLWMYFLASFRQQGSAPEHHLGENGQPLPTARWVKGRCPIPVPRRLAP